MNSYFYTNQIISGNGVEQLIKAKDEVMYDLQIINQSSTGSIFVYLVEKEFNVNNYIEIKAGGYISFEKSVPLNAIYVSAAAGVNCLVQYVK